MHTRSHVESTHVVNLVIMPNLQLCSLLETH